MLDVFFIYFDVIEVSLFVNGFVKFGGICCIIRIGIGKFFFKDLNIFFKIGGLFVDIFIFIIFVNFVFLIIFFFIVSLFFNEVIVL